MSASSIKRPTKQVYSDYTTEDFEVWKILFDRQTEILQSRACHDYLEALKIVGFNRNEIPRFDKIGNALRGLTGWQLEVVPNISEQIDFFQFLAQKKFTATCWVRSMNQLDYLEEPDMFHDVFGHVPLLSNKHYTDFFQGISEIALDFIDNPKAIELIGRVYWYTIGFGLIRQNDGLRIYGAGIISSKGETVNCLSESTGKIDFSIKEMFNTPFRTDILQDRYFVIDSFEQLYQSIPEIRSELIDALD